MHGSPSRRDAHRDPRLGTPLHRRDLASVLDPWTVQAVWEATVTLAATLQTGLMYMSTGLLEPYVPLDVGYWCVDGA